MGVSVREKAIVEMMHDYNITCSYDETLLFRGSAAHAAVHSKENFGLADTDGVVQVVADNFDATISSANCMKSTHALAMLVTQPQDDFDQISAGTNTQIKRLSKAELSNRSLPDVPIQIYQGPVKPSMPDKSASQSPMSLTILCRQVISLGRAQETDFRFMKDIVHSPCIPEYGGYNTAQSRAQGHGIQKATKALYLPLIDMPPANPSTMLTAMTEAQNITNETGQAYTIFTNDQQLYRIAVGITWVYSDLFINFIPRLGGMHMLMSFVGAVGTLMTETGLEDIMSAAFAGVSHMLKGKKYPHNIRALRMVVEELLRSVSHTSSSYNGMMIELQRRASLSRVTKLWLENLIQPVFVMMLFIRAEREADWPLHLYAVKRMLPYFFASGHVNYARYSLYYLISMSKLPLSVEKRFVEGKHAMRHQPGIYNGQWSDLFIESTFMRYGHSPGGIIGFTLNSSAVKRWAYSLHICSQLRRDVFELSGEHQERCVTVHKEEGLGRIHADSADREKIRNKLQTCIDPLDPTSHRPDALVNIARGRIASSTANVDQAVKLGNDLMSAYRSGWPQSFHAKLSKPTISMRDTRKDTKVGDTTICDPSLIFSRILCLQEVRDIDFKGAMAHELAMFPTSLFDDRGIMSTKAKSLLKNKLQVEVTEISYTETDAIILDGCAVLWVVCWPAQGLVKDFLKNLLDYVATYVGIADTYIVFDRYFDKSIKAAMRTERAGKHGSRQHQLTLDTPLPPQTVCLSVTHNKVQLISLFHAYIQECNVEFENMLVVNSGDNPIQIYNSELTPRPDLCTRHEEADVIIVQEAVRLALCRT